MKMKKILFLALLLIFCMSAVTAYAARPVPSADGLNAVQCDAPAHTAGDINGDGRVTNADLTRLMKYIAGDDVKVNKACLDVNGDGKVDNRDLSRLMKHLADPDVEIY